VRLLLNNLQRQKTILILDDSNSLLLSINGSYLEFRFMWFGGSLKQRHFTLSGKRQKLGNFRG